MKQMMSGHDRFQNRAVRVFDNRLSEEWKGFVILRRVIIAIAIVHFSLAAMSGYRAIVQVYDVSILTGSSMVRGGSPIEVRVRTSGRTHVNARLELVQNGHAETLGMTLIWSNDQAFYDPRPKPGVMYAVIPPDVLSRFAPGEATLRAVAVGRSQFLRTPPPTVSEMTVRLIPSG